MQDIEKAYALIIGIILTLIGGWGFFLPLGTGKILLVFGVNYLQSALHLIAGLFGIYIGIKEKGRGYNATIGWIALTLGVLGFIPFVKDQILSYLNINFAISLFHLILGLISLGVYYAGKGIEPSYQKVKNLLPKTKHKKAK